MQMKYAVAKHYGLLVSEVYKKMPRFKKIFEVRNQQAALRALQAEHDA